MSCMIVCASACRGCPAIACLDRIAECEAPEGKAHVGIEIWTDELDEVKEQDLQAKCAMRSDISCRHCHEEDCKIRLAPRRF